MKRKIIFATALMSTVCLLCYGEVLAEGKTKIVHSYPQDRSLAIFESKDMITAGDGAKRDEMEGKAVLANNTTCNVFRLLKDCGIPVAFREQVDARSFLADYCDMIQYEVVARREAHGSYLKRHPQLEKGTIFPQLIVEFYLKTTDKVWKGMPIPKDDPFIVFQDGKAQLFRPDMPIESQQPFMVLDDYPLIDRPELFKQIEMMTRQIFLALEKAWQLEGGRLVDMKVEYGLDSQGNLLLADVIDNDSWRVVQNQQYIDKQVYRDGGALDKVLSLYKYVSEKTNNFKIPQQQIILWRGSPTDDFTPFTKNLEYFEGEFLKVTQVTSSMHKNPVGSYQKLNKLAQNVPDSVVVAYVGSNGAGPTLAANATIPVITVPQNYEHFENDVWSSLRAPSLVPVLTVLEPSNGALAALQILAMRNPRLYMQLRLKQEERLVNVLEVK